MSSIKVPVTGKIVDLHISVRFAMALILTSDVLEWEPYHILSLDLVL